MALHVTQFIKIHLIRFFPGMPKKIIFGEGCSPDPAGELTALPQIMQSVGEGDTLPVLTPLDALGI